MRHGRDAKRWTATALIALSACAAAPAASYGAETWLEPETLSEPGTSNLSARIATNSPGVAAVVLERVRQRPRPALPRAGLDPQAGSGVGPVRAAVG